MLYAITLLKEETTIYASGSSHKSLYLVDSQALKIPSKHTLTY